MGDDHQTSVDAGSSTLFLPPVPPATVSQPNTVPGGLLALSSNIGRFHKDEFTFMPEAMFQVGYRLFRCTDVVMGYQFTYLSKAIRPGSNIDAVINPVYLPTRQFFGGN